MAFYSGSLGRLWSFVLGLGVTFIGAFCAPAIAQVATPPGVVLTGLQFNGTNTVGQLLSTATFEGRLAAGSTSVAQGLNMQRAVTFSRTTVANGARSRIALGGAVAISAVVLGIGWALDQLTGQVTTTTPATSEPSAGQSWGTQAPCTSSPSLAALKSCFNSALSSHFGMPGTHIRFVNRNSTGTEVYFDIYYNSGTRLGDGPTFYCNSCTQPVRDWVLTANAATGAEPGAATTAAVSDTALADAVNTSPAAVREVFTHPNGMPRLIGPELVAAANQVQAAVAAQQGVSPSTLPAIVADNEAASPTSANSFQGTSWPSFCGWAPRLCTLADWMDGGVGSTDGASDALDPPDNISTSLVSYTSGLGNGTCPANRAVTGGGISFSYRFTPWCDLAAMIRPLVIAAALFSSMLILIGVQKQNA